jgi:hypothetical protein
MVLTLVQLPTPEAIFCGCGGAEHDGQTDYEGNKVMVPMMFKATRPDASARPEWVRQNITMAEVWEDDNGEDWREFPSILGVPEIEALENPFSWGGFYPVAVWSFIPLLTEEDKRLGYQVVNGAAMALEVSLYEDLQSFFSWCDYLTESDMEPEELNEEEQDHYLTVRGALEEYGYIGPPNPPDPDADSDDVDQWDWDRTSDFELEPIEDWIQSPAAVALWQDLLYQSRHGYYAVINSVPRHERVSFVYHYLGRDPWS